MAKQPNEDPGEDSLGFHIKWYTWAALFVVAGFMWWGIYEVVTHSVIMRLFN